MKTDRRELFKILGVAAPALLPVLDYAQEGQTKPSADKPVQEMAKMPSKPGSPLPIKRSPAFTPQEWRTMHVLSDLIIPADERSGSATQAGVPEYIDEVISDKERKDKGRLEAQLHGGIAWLNLEAKRRFRKDFPSSSVAQQKEILDLIAYPAKALPEHSQAVAFFSRFRDLCASGFYTSKIGIDDLQFKGNKVLSHWDGCPPEVLAKLGL